MYEPLHSAHWMLRFLPDSLTLNMNKPGYKMDGLNMTVALLSVVKQVFPVSCHTQNILSDNIEGGMAKSAKWSKFAEMCKIIHRDLTFPWCSLHHSDMPSSSSSGWLIIKLGPCQLRIDELKFHNGMEEKKQSSGIYVDITSAKMFRSESVIMHAISMIWSFSMSRPVILKKKLKNQKTKSSPFTFCDVNLS